MPIVRSPIRDRHAQRRRVALRVGDLEAQIVVALVDAHAVVPEANERCVFAALPVPRRLQPERDRAAGGREALHLTRIGLGLRVVLGLAFVRGGGLRRGRWRFDRRRPPGGLTGGPLPRRPECLGCRPDLARDHPG